MSGSTIFAPASAPGRCGVTVIRISGPRASVAIEQVTRAPLPEPRRATLKRFRHPITSEILDEGLILWFPAPRSFTGEDVAELHIHGGRAVMIAMLEALSAVPGLRPAEPGEFSRRAYLNGRMDLTSAEGLADLIGAETEAQRAQAFRQMDGELARLCDEWRGLLTGMMARMEAVIDFPDEGIPDAIAEGITHDAADLLAVIRTHLAEKRGEVIRNGLYIVIAGAPNAGKSSLLNALTRQDAAIVSDVAGTTRDPIEVRLDLGGVMVTLCDTAGLRGTADAIEAEGVARALQRAERADLRLCLFDAKLLPELDSATMALVNGNALPIVTKCDLAAMPAGIVIAGKMPLAISTRTGEGVEELLEVLKGRAAEYAAPSGHPVFTRERHRAALAECADCLARFLSGVSAPPELRAEDARLAARAVGRITGAIDSEEVLDSIFRQFCIGK